MSIRKNSESRKHIIWFVSFILLVIPVYLGQFDLTPYPAARYAVYATSLLAYGLLAFKIYVLDGHGKKELLYITPILGALALGVVCSGIRSLFSTGLLVLACRDVPFRRIAKGSFFLFAGFLLLNLALVLAGVLEDTTIIRGELIGNGNVRHTLGFGYPNTFALWGMVTAFAALLTGGRKIKIVGLTLLFSLSIFLLTDSKAAFLSALTAGVLCLIFRILEKRVDLTANAPWVLAGLTVLAAFGFVALALLYREENRGFALLNTLFSQRLGYANQGFRLFGVSLFGAKGIDFGWDPVDSFYAYGPICMGVVPCLIYLLFCAYGVFRSVKAGHWEIAAAALAGALFNTMEYALMNPIFLPVFAACACLESDKNESNPSV